MDSFIYILIAIALFAFQAYSEGQKKKRAAERRAQQRGDSLEEEQLAESGEVEELTVENLFDFILKGEERREKVATIEDEPLFTAEDEIVDDNPFAQYHDYSGGASLEEEYRFGKDESKLEPVVRSIDDVLAEQAAESDVVIQEEPSFEFDAHQYIIYSLLDNPKFRD